jgi:radical SAM superfamily enzyme YgiQ (UPF0313 family)
MRITLVAINARFTHSCLALFHVRNALEAYCPKVELKFLQLTVNDSYYQMLLRISAATPDAVFISTVIWNSDLVERLIRDLHVSLPKCSFVIGGPEAEGVGNNLGRGNCTVVTGDIESIGADFYRDLLDNNLKDRYNGSFFQTNNCSFISPYRDPDFFQHLHQRHIYYETSRGCPFCCTYCLSSTQKGIIYKGLPQVESELEQILSHQPAVLRFVDRTFNALPERALAIWKYLAARKTDTLYHFEISPDLFSEEMYDFLKDVPPGLFQFEIGIQSTNPETLKAVHRPTKTKNAHTLVTRLATFQNIHLHVDLILGLPYETEGSFYQSFSDVFTMNAHYIQMGLLKILPNTSIRQNADEFGYKYCHRPPYAIIASEWMNHAVLSDLYWFSECVERFMNNRYFVALWSYFRRIAEDIVSFFRYLLSFCRDNSFFDRAPTQELMCQMLLLATKNRNDAELVLELLRFNWLRCGHRFLPECLMIQDENEQPLSLKKKLSRFLPAKLEGAYDIGQKNQFLKKGLFVRFSEKSMIEFGYSDQTGNGYLCFLQEKEKTLYAFAHVVRLEGVCGTLM